MLTSCGWDFYHNKRISSTNSSLLDRLSDGVDALINNVDGWGVRPYVMNTTSQKECLPNSGVKVIQFP